jgi:tetratricopeptide (TPR) repeat protein
MAAFQRAGFAWGLVVAYHNLGITYRDQGDLDRARDMADRAVEGAARVGDLALCAQAAAGRAEIRVAARAPVAARVEAERALACERLGDVVGAAEDRRILAAALAALGDAAGAERLLGTAVEEAERHGRPLLAAAARRDLGALLEAAGRRTGPMRYAARAAFSGLGAAAEVRKLDALLARL